jgi:hypothetical protein
MFMTIPARILCVVILVAAVAVCASAPDAGNAHFVIANNEDYYYPNPNGNNFGTVMKLFGPKSDPSLTPVASLNTQALSAGGGDIPNVQVVRHGSNICVFLQDGIDSNGNNQISAFKYPSMTLVANYSDPNIPNGLYPYSLISSGNYVFVGFARYISTWGIEPGCTLSHLQTSGLLTLGPGNLAATPNGKSLISSAEDADAYLIGPNGEITEAGPYGLTIGQGVPDVTADSQYVIFGHDGCAIKCYVAVSVVGINPDGSLNPNSGGYFGGNGTLGLSQYMYAVRLSPDERFIYGIAATQDPQEKFQITTFDFTESPLNVTYHKGCTTTLNLLSGISADSLVTASPSGSGGALYVAESNEAGGGQIALLGINSVTGCTTEAPGSPFSLGDPYAAVTSIVTWPPRPF